MYQQQQFVDRIRHTDKSVVLAIATTLWQQQEEEKKNTPMPSADALYRQVLQDAEDQLARYEMLGLGVSSTRKQQRTYPHDSPPPPPSSHPSLSEALSSSESAALSSVPSPPPATPSAPPPGASATTVLKPAAAEATAAPRHGNRKYAMPSSFTFSATGRRKRTRSTLAFGHKLPVMKDSEFQLPYEEFGQLMERRAKMAPGTLSLSSVRTRRRQQQQQQKQKQQEP
ncbi:hypothetical protein BX666DRAFT_1338944 [Dichotomocladium elegans]|nr:hypothetical protein BX666DRAFT_1338944 [Dichotomocladium elegans]